MHAIKPLRASKAMKSDLTIIKSGFSLVNYPFQVLPPDVVGLMARCGTKLPTRLASCMPPLTKLFEAYCHLTGSEVTYLSLSSPSFSVIAKGFLGALSDESLISVGSQTRTTYRRTFLLLLEEMRNEIPLLPEFASSEQSPKSNHHLWEKQKESLNPKLIRYWSGWGVRSQKATAYLPICLVWNAYGEEFAEAIYARYCQDAAKRLTPAHTEFSLFLVFIADNADSYSASSFKNPLELNEIFTKFMVFNFMRALDNGADISSKARNYSKFISLITDTYITPGVWARPFSHELPRPIAQNRPGTHTNIKKSTDGTLIKNKLITEIPLHITDSEAIEILFKNIDRDIKLTINWAKNKLSELRRATLKKERLASTGQPIFGGNTLKKSISECGENNLCATLEHYGLAYIRTNREKTIGSSSRTELAKLFAIPTIEHHFALQVLLTHAYPKLTDSLFENLELYDKRGNLFGFLKLDSGYQLTGYKDRRGPDLSEIKIILTPREAAWVRRMIVATQPLRDELRKAGDDAWRFLFLHSGRSISYPSRPKTLTLNSGTLKQKQKLVEEFGEVNNINHEESHNLLLRLSLTTLRASSAVQIFLETGSAEDMSQALGHATYDSSLLSRYLPEPILAFIQTRWIRAFQRGIICKAMAGSPRLLEVTRFESMDKLHEFLSNHALRDIPQHLQNPDYPYKNPSKSPEEQGAHESKVLISIGVGLLTVLISLSDAVLAAKDSSTLCPKAIYWARLTNLIIREIEEGYNSDLQEQLDIARRNADPSQMEMLIHAITT